MAAPGGLELAKLIKSMRPTLQDGTFIFATVASDSKLLEQAIPKADMLFKESEGWTIIVTQAIADDLGIDFIFPCRKVTLDVHSSLEAVGFLAAITSRLADKLRIGVSGYYHDHLFVPLGKEDLVVEELKQMAAEQE
ncbi:hypothetical protein LTR36_010779 [Oleoguttula mirabilis]|uniref:DUF2241 domain-containing protein n=1 Tax=Oleoguttula mirabilis TaxID=1507867 RepID=A0AAV9JR37_9PEZI|nr:hypothetical protein LTR36_010779 [Oleoguttula mirabilis]